MDIGKLKVKSNSVISLPNPYFEQFKQSAKKKKADDQFWISNLKVAAA